MEKSTETPNCENRARIKTRIDYAMTKELLSIKVLGEISFFLGERRLTLESADLRAALVYLALEPLPISYHELARFVGAKETTEFYQDLQTFAASTSSLEFLAQDCLRLHAIVDVLLFEYALQDGYFAEALTIYQGETDKTLFGRLKPKTVRFQEWCLIEQARLRLSLQEALRGRYETLALADDIDGAIRIAKQLLSLDPLDEYTHQRIMQLELFRGNFSAALEQFQTCKGVLAQLLGVEPLTETTELADIIDALSYDQSFSEGLKSSES